jgi:hypothetical protein
MTKQIKTPNGYIPLHRARYHNHIALKDGKIFIYDNSGRDPDETDDGPLVVAVDVLEEAGAIKVEAMYVRGDYSSPFGPQATIPVRDIRSGRVGTYSTHVDLEGAIKLGRRLGLKVDLVTNVYDPKPKQ